MFALLAVALLLIAAVAILVIRVWRPGFGYSWLVAALGSLVAWGLALAAWGQAPRSFQPLVWEPRALLPASPLATLDAVSWPFLLAVVGLNLAAVLADVQRISPAEGERATRGDLAAGLGLAAAAALATLAGNLLTLLLLWSAVDLALLLIWVGRARSDGDIEEAVIGLTLRLASHILIVWAGLTAGNAGVSTGFSPVEPQVAPFLIAAAGLRLGLLPPHRPVPARHGLRPGLNTLAWLAPAAAALVPLERAARSGAPRGASWFLVFGAGAIVYAGWSWLNARSPHGGMPHYLLGYSALALAGAARGIPFAGMAWGLAGLLIGGMAALMGPRTRATALPLLAGGLFAAGLPLTPTWPGVGLFAWPFPPAIVAYLFGLGLLLAGFVRLGIRPAPSPPTAERWVWLIYPLGLAIPPATLMVIAVMLRPGAPGGLPAWPGAPASGLSLIAVGVAVFAAAALQRRKKPRRRPGPQTERLKPALEWAWLYRGVWLVYRLLGRTAERIAWALEGRAGLLWALLALALLVSLLTQIGLGG